MEVIAKTGIPDIYGSLLSYNPFELRGMHAQWQAQGLGWIIHAGWNLESSRLAVEMAWTYPLVAAGIGLLPAYIDPADLSPLEELADLASDPGVAAINAGLDTELANVPVSLQESVLTQLADIASRSTGALILHLNGSASQLLSSWSDRPNVSVSVCDFHGSMQDAKTLVDSGFFLSIGPSTLGLNGKQPVDETVLRWIPEERLLFNSSPSKPEGSDVVQRTVLEVLKEIVNRMAAIRGCSEEELLSVVNDNLWNFLKWRPK